MGTREFDAASVGQTGDALNIKRRAWLDFEKRRKRGDPYTVRPPSIGSTTPVTNSASSLARYTQALAMSDGRDMRPSGMVAMNLASVSGVAGPPRTASVRPVSPSTGAMQLTRMRIGASSTASDFETRFTKPLEPLY